MQDTRRQESRAQNIVFGLVILLAFLALGEIIVRFAGMPVPGNIVGLVLLAAALAAGLVPLPRVERVSDWLLDHLGLFFVPPGVGIMLHWNLIRREWLPILAAFVLSTFAVLAVTGAVARALGRSGDKP